MGATFLAPSKVAILARLNQRNPGLFIANFLPTEINQLDLEIERENHLPTSLEGWATTPSADPSG